MLEPLIDVDVGLLFKDSKARRDKDRNYYFNQQNYMIIKNLIGFLVLIVLNSCRSDSSYIQVGKVEKNSSGFSIKNSTRYGQGYVDTNAIPYNYLHITTTISNDSSLPMRLVINFSEGGSYSNDSLIPRVFLLPRKWVIPKKGLTPANKKINLIMLNELKWFLDRVDENPVSLDTLLKPRGKCILTFGLLNNPKYDLPYAIGVKASLERLSTQPLKLSFDRLPNEHYLIPCGEVSFITK